MSVPAILAMGMMVLGASSHSHNSQFKALVKQGEGQYHDGKYADAAATLKQAYEIEPNSNLLYNIARALEQGGNLPDALDYYQRYVASTEGTDATLLKRSALSIDRIKVLLAQSEAERAKQKEEREKAEAAAKAATEQAAKDADAAAKARAEAHARQVADVTAAQETRSQRRITGIAVGIVGLLGIASGVVFGILTGSAHSSFVMAADVATKDKFVSTTKTYALIADLSFAVGAAALITAVIVFPKGSEPTVTVGLTPTPGGMALVGSF